MSTVDIRTLRDGSTTALMAKVQKVRQLNSSLAPHQHDKACPVRVEPGRDCRWPQAVCVPEGSKL